ncbi:MAG TPA: short-chain dehydrogenase/reductase, partial [Hyphomonas sp.]|nr:short-chain dehydrogenase/reductase [Hyphomonas sp.]
MKTWLITGVGKGLGKDLAETVLQRGDRVVGTVRS